MTILQTIAILCTALLIAQNPCTFAQEAQPAGAPQGQTQSTLTPQQLDSLVAPIALYPDPILSQTLVASTYPLEIVEAGRWLSKHSHLKGQALADAAKQQKWDASVQALVMIPDVLKRMDQDVSWTTNLGNTFLAQEDGVMEAIQRMRKQAADAGVLQSTPQQTVSTVTENGHNYIVIEPARPEVVSVPQYNPVAVWGAAPQYYPYPPLYYPLVPSTGAVVAASAISFGAGIAVGAIWGSGGWGSWGWNCGWGHRNVVINNNFINNNHFNRVNVGSGNAWVHNPAHRGRVPYNNAQVANRFQGAGAGIAARPTAGQTQQKLLGNSSTRGGGQRSIGSANRSIGSADRSIGSANRSIGSADRSIGSANRFIGSADRSIGGANRFSPGGGEAAGNRRSGKSGGGRSAFNQGGARAQVSGGRGSSNPAGSGLGRGGSRGGGVGSRGGRR